jgi:hypothetical protein
LKQKVKIRIFYWLKKLNVTMKVKNEILKLHRCEINFIMKLHYSKIISLCEKVENTCMCLYQCNNICDPHKLKVEWLGLGWCGRKMNIYIWLIMGPMPM